MAQPIFQEPNQAKWVGVRPGSSGSLVTDYGTKDDGSLAMYEVSGGEVLLLTNASFVVDNRSGATGVGQIAIRTGGAAIWWLFVEGEVKDESIVHGLCSFWPPLEVPAGYDFYLYSNAVALTSRLSIQGWLEDA